MKIFLFVLLAIFLAFITYRYYMRMGLDSINVYRMRLNKSKVFTRIHKFVNKQGLPKQVKLFNETIPIDSVDDLYNVITKAENTHYELFLLYDGYTMHYFRDGRLVISSIDLRKSEEGLTYKGVIFDNNFTFNDFEELFPSSASNESILDKSLFEVETNEFLPQASSYFLFRWSKDSIFADPMVEFTFLDGKLIYIFFANF